LKKGKPDMFYQIILKVIIAMLVVSSLANTASAQLKNSHNSNQVSIDWSVLDKYRANSSLDKIVSETYRNSGLLKPPPKMPRSQFLGKSRNLKPVRKLSRLKFQPIKKLQRNRFKKTKRSNKAKILKPKNKKSTQIISKIKPPAGNIGKKLPISEKQSVRKSTELETSAALNSVETKFAPAPKARPTAPVIVLEAPPPTPKIITESARIESNFPQIAPPTKDINQQVKLLIFKQGNAELSSEAKKTLDNVSAKLKLKPNSRMQLQAYAGEPNLSASRARRLSLSRALSARSYLIKKGIRSTRIDVRALGNKTASGEPNRVDIRLIKN
jgi:outer membrane protein OmpA-like peptidoglycan-associated protein